MNTLNERWQALESAGLVRLRAEPEQESYFDVYGEPEGYEASNGRLVSAKEERAELEHQLELNGCWCVISEYFDGTDWQMADSIGMCMGYDNVLDPKQNDYVPDLMASALSKVPQPGEH